MTAPPESGDHQRGTGRARTFRRRPCTGWYRHGGVLTVPAGRPGREAELRALGAVEVYELLVGQRGWSPERYRDWLVVLD